MHSEWSLHLEYDEAYEGSTLMEGLCMVKYRKEPHGDLSHYRWLLNYP